MSNSFTSFTNSLGPLVSTQYEEQGNVRISRWGAEGSQQVEECAQHPLRPRWQVDPGGFVDGPRLWHWPLGWNICESGIFKFCDYFWPFLLQLFKRLYGEDYFDRMRSLSKSKAETAIINVGGERHEVMMMMILLMMETRIIMMILVMEMMIMTKTILITMTIWGDFWNTGQTAGHEVSSTSSSQWQSCWA